MAYSTLKTAAVMAMLEASVAMTVSPNPGDFLNCRTAYRKSCRNDCMAGPSPECQASELPFSNWQQAIWNEQDEWPAPRGLPEPVSICGTRVSGSGQRIGSAYLRTGRDFRTS